MTSPDRRTALLALLADGQQHSGQALGDALGVSRAAVWKLVVKLRAQGVEVESGTGAGYQLPQAVELLDAAAIRRELSADADTRLQSVDAVLALGSTNEELLRLSGSSSRPRALLAESQSAGRGRRGRQWYSPFGASLYLSLLWPFEELGHGLSGLSLVVGIVVANAIERTTGVKPALKWPNDVVYQDRKLAGILIELVGEPQGPCKAVIGIGINCSLPSSAKSVIDQPWVDLVSIKSCVPERNALAASILSNCCSALPIFAEHGFAAFQSQWQQRDALMGRQVRLQAGSNAHAGIVRGVDDSGALLLENESGVASWVSGEVSVRLSS